MTSRIGELVIDCHDPEATAQFWCAALGYRITDHDETGFAIAGDSAAPTILLLKSDDPKDVKNRLHLDICPVDTTQSDEVERLLARQRVLRHVERDSWRTDAVSSPRRPCGAGGG